MDRYAVYSYELKPHPVQTSIDRPVEPLTKKDDAQAKFDSFFGSRGQTIPVSKLYKGKIIDYPFEVLAHDHRVVLLRLENLRDETVLEKKRTADDAVATIKPHFYTSHPYVYVIFDNRPGDNPLKGLMLVKVDTDLWRNSDTVCTLLETNLNEWLRLKQFMGYEFSIHAKTLVSKKEFVSKSVARINAGHAVNKMTLRFDGAKLNSYWESRIANSPLLESLRKSKYNAAEGELALTNNQKGLNIVDDGNIAELELVVNMVVSNQNFGLSLFFDDGIAYTCERKKEMRSDVPSPDDAHLVEFQSGHPAADKECYQIERWLDDQVKDVIKDLSDVKINRRKATRKNRRQSAA